MIRQQDQQYEKDTFRKKNTKLLTAKHLV